MTNKEWVGCWLFIMLTIVALTGMIIAFGKAGLENSDRIYNLELLTQCMEQMTYKECKEELK